MNTINWTPDQWEEYEATTITVPLPLFDAMQSAMDMLARGVRLNERERARWRKKLVTAMKYQQEAYAEIETP